MKTNKKYVFGPVPSRRLGRSLGIDLIPFKTCTMDCVYCQLGETTCEISERGNYVPIQDVLGELEEWKNADGKADHITLAGSGEPTLHTYFGDVLQWVKEETEIPSALLTNGTLLHLGAVREQAALADKVKVTLSAWDEASFQQIHRPAQSISFDMLIQGERAFRKKYSGELSVEVFIVDGVNAQMSQAQQIAELVQSLEPDHVDINTVVRPPAVKGVTAPDKERLDAICSLFGENAHVTASYRKQGFTSLDISEEALMQLIRRHPATCSQLAGEFNVSDDSMYRLLRTLKTSGVLTAEKTGAETYYLAASAQ